MIANQKIQSKFLIGVIVLFSVLSCAKPKSLYVQTGLENVTIVSEKDAEIAAFLHPYRDSMRLVMDSVIGYSPMNMIRNRPESILGNFMVDETVNYVLRKEYADATTPTLCIMNFGGMRSPMSRGNITIGDIYSLMPFDNIIVVAKLPKSALEKILVYNQSTGGEPIAGFTIKNDELKPVGFDQFNDTIEIVTTDYLFNGGDKMDFFQSAYSSFNTGVLLRDALIQQVSLQDTVNVVIDQRIYFDNE